MPLAAGGMARIYIGRSTGIGSFERHVVLKMITPEKANDLTAVNMFLDEARLAASLNHQNVAQVFEVGEDAGIHYLAMEYVHGQDLRAVLAKAGSQGTRIPLELALTVVAGAAAGLHHAHERRGPDGTPLGIVHRDVSPSNIMIGYDGAVKLLDFGIAKATARSVETQSGIIKGKFAYMAPEQCRGREVDRRSDVFSLGIILYEISTQHRCFRADSDFDTMHRIVTGDVVRPTRLVQGYPQALEAIVMKALAVDPAQRYQSSGLLLEALESFAVSSRMSLSTMGLGRFMRDMFGEVQEPWLNTAATKVLQPLVAKESTISSTNGHGRASQPQVAPARLDDDLAIPEEDGRFPDSAKAEAAKTLLDLPHERDRPQLMNEPPSTEWGPDLRVYGSGQPALAPPGALPPGALPHGGYPQAMMPHGMAPEMLNPGTPPTGVPGMYAPLAPSDLPLPPPRIDTPPQGQFSVAPGSSSGQAIPALGIGSANLGYPSAAMARGDISYPRYEVTPDAFPAPDVQLRPNRRPLFIGLGIIVVGVIVMLAVSFGGSDESVAPAPEPPEESVVQESTEVAPEPPPPPATDIIEENMVSVIIHSDPAGADVLIAGTKIGTTPFESKLKRGTKITQLTVQKADYAPFQGKIDLGGEYENRNIKLARLEDLPQGGEELEQGSASEAGSAADKGSAATPAKKSEPSDKGTQKGAGATRPTRTSTPPRNTPPRRERREDRKEEKKEEKCQPPGPNVDPFGPPICKT